MNHELGISFRAEEKTKFVIAETARKYGLDIDMLGVYDDLGDYPPFLHLMEAARSLPSQAETNLGPVGVAIAKYTSMVDVVGYMSMLNDIRPDHVFLGFVPGAWMDQLGLETASVQRMREAVESTRYLVEKRTEGYQGYFKIDPAFVVSYPTPKKLPILIGGWGEKFAALAGELADEIKIGGSANPLLVPVIQQRVGNSEVGIVFGAVTVIDEDRHRAIAVAREKALIYINVVGSKDITVQQNYSEQISAIKQAMANNDRHAAMRYLSDDLIKRFVFAGTPHDIIGQTEILFAQGVKRVEFGTPHGATDEFTGVELLVKKVFPHFRK